MKQRRTYCMHKTLKSQLYPTQDLPESKINKYLLKSQKGINKQTNKYFNNFVSTLIR